MFEQAPRTAELLQQVTRQEQEMIDDLRDLLDRHFEVRVEHRRQPASWSAPWDQSCTTSLRHPTPSTSHDWKTSWLP